MIEVAIASMHEALAANGETAPEGSLVPEREPMPDATALAKEVEARQADEGAAAAARDPSEDGSPDDQGLPAPVAAESDGTGS